MNLTYLESFAAIISSLISLEAVIGLVAIALFYWNRFNSWTEKEAKYGKTRPPRQFTTWARFMTYATLYTLSMEVIYLVLLFSPNLIQFLEQLFGAVPVSNADLNPGGRDFSLWVMVFLLGFYPHLPVLKQIEDSYRHWLHQRAFIPAEAKALIHQLVANPGFFEPDEKTTKKVRQKFGQGMPEDWGAQQNEDHLNNKWFRLIFLREKLMAWRSRPEIERFVGHCEEEYRLFQDQFKQLHLDVETFLEQRNGNNDERNSEHLDQHKISVILQIENLLGRVYEFVICGILTTERIHSRRIAKLNYFGLFPNYEPGVPIILDIVLKNAVVVFIITSVTSISYLWYLKVSGGKSLNLALGFVWALIALVMIGLCILGAVVVYRVLTRKNRFKVADNGDTLVIGPFVFQCIGFAVGYICGWLVIFPYLAIAAEKSFLSILPRSLPWPLIPAITAGFIVYYLAEMSNHNNRIIDALKQGLVTAFMGIISSIWAFQNLDDKLPNFIFIVSTSLLIGMAIGFLFPSAYRRRVSAIYSGPERRTSPRIAIGSQVMMRSGKESTPCEAVNISASGAWIKVACNAAVGDIIQLELPGLGWLNGQVVRKEEQDMAVTFQPDSKRELCLLNTIGTMPFAMA